MRIRLAAYLSLFVRFYVYFMSFASLGALSIVIRLAAFWSVVVGSVLCVVFAVVFSVVGNSLSFPL